MIVPTENTHLKRNVAILGQLKVSMPLTQRFHSLEFMGIFIQMGTECIVVLFTKAKIENNPVIRW